jgi:DNA repair photolyase
VLRYLPKDIELARQLGLGHLPVMVSCSTDPLQPLELEVRHSAKVLELLAAGGFPLIVMTQNPGVLLDGRYLDSLKRTQSLVEISVASRYAGTGGRGIFSSLAPPAADRIAAMRELVRESIQVRLRLDPIIPRATDDGPGQDVEDLRWVVRQASEAGASMVISKTMVLTPQICPQTHASLRTFYRGHGAERASNGDESVDVLDSETQRRLLAPVRQACEDFGIAFCSCVSLGLFSEAVSCRFPEHSGQQ